MKRVFAVLCAMLCFLTGCSGGKEAAENPYRLKSFVCVEPEAHRTFEVSCSYDGEGNLSREEITEDGEPGSVTTYTYDAWGNLLRMSRQDPDGTVRITEYELTLDEAHRILYQASRSDGVLTDTTETDYDRKGNPIRVDAKSYSPDGKELWPRQIEMTYDSHGNITERTIQWPNDPSRDRVTRYTYENGRCLREESCFPNGRLRDYTEYIYDDREGVSAAMEYEADGTLFSKTVCAYDAYGNVLRQEYYCHSGRLPGGGDDVVDKIIHLRTDRWRKGKPLMDGEYGFRAGQFPRGGNQKSL